MVKKNAATKKKPAFDVATAPRQSVVRFAQYVQTIADHAPDKLDDLVDPDTVAAVQAAIDGAENYTDTVTPLIEKAIAGAVDRAAKALSNDDPLNGYVGYGFDPELFSEKTKIKVKRAARTPSEKAAKIVETASEEQLAALAELLKARGMSLALDA